eukprot:m.161713 g.161713  ORF g.161713 m.161713 type:complete len:605 (-) comp31250_c1_seq1:196-2010(-)
MRHIFPGYLVVLLGVEVALFDPLDLPDAMHMSTPPTLATAKSFNSSFEGGNIDVELSQWTTDNVLSYIGAIKCGPASSKCSPYTNWVYFSVSNFSVTHPTTLVALSHDWSSPPWYSYSDGDDGSDWIRINTPARTLSEGLGYTHQFVKPLAYIAFSIPYVPSKQRRQLLKDLQKSSGQGVTAVPLLVTMSEANNAVIAVNISNTAARNSVDGSKSQKTLVWFQARQHAWESGSSWVADGVARYAVSVAGSAALLQVADVVVNPIMDVDNVVVGGDGKDQEPVDFNRDWCPLGQIARNETGAKCQHWAAISATITTIQRAMASGMYNNLIFVDSHSPGNPAEPAQVWTECATGPTAVSPTAWNLTQAYKVFLGHHSESCGRLAYKQWCAEVGPAYGNKFSGYHANEISFMYLFYQEYATLMNAPHSRSMSYSHETSGATATEAHCYGAAIGASLAELIQTTGALNTTGASTTCTGYPSTCFDRPPPSPPSPPPPVPHHSGYNVTGAGKKDCNGVYINIPAPPHWEHSAFYQKDATHSLYRYRDPDTGAEIWHICHTGVTCYYDAPPSSNGADEPPSIGWVVAPNSVGLLPAPTLTAFDSMLISNE